MERKKKITVIIFEGRIEVFQRESMRESIDESGRIGYFRQNLMQMHPEKVALKVIGSDSGGFHRYVKLSDSLKKCVI